MGATEGVGGVESAASCVKKEGEGRKLQFSDRRLQISDREDYVC